MTRLPVLASAPFALILTACLFGKEEGAFTYTTELHGLTRTLHAYNADGSVKGNLGIGIETTDGDGMGLSGDGGFAKFGETGLLVLWPFAVSDGSEDGVFGGNPFLDDSTFIANIDEYASAKPVPFVGITRDSTYVLGVDMGILLPQVYVRKARAGFPCTFSRPRAFQIASSGDTISLKVRGTHLDRADTVRLAVLLDESALAAETRFDSTEPVTGTVRVTCPDP